MTGITHSLMRHPVPDIEAGVCYGRLDVPLLPGWDEQLSNQLDRLVGTGTIVTSPSRRCRQPATWLATRLSAALVVEPRLMELDFGDWEGRRWSSFDGKQARAWAENPIDRAPPGGESMRGLQSRVLAGFRDWTAGRDGTLFVTHGGPIRVLLCHQRGLSLHHAFQQEVAYATLHDIRVAESGESTHAS